MEAKNKKRAAAALGMAGAAVLTVAALWTELTVRQYKVEAENIETPLRLALVADLHSVPFGDDQGKLMSVIRLQEPDIVVMTGDIVDNHVSRDGAEQLLRQLGREFPSYYVSGNHEVWTGDLEGIKDMIRQYGVTVLEGGSAIQEVRGQRVRICGVDDPDRFAEDDRGQDDLPEGWLEQFSQCRGQTGDGVFTLLLSHRPEPVEVYRDSGFDLVLSGHAHGGLVRLPGLPNGLLAADQGLFPKYTCGRHDLGATPMIVSRGLSLVRWPRIFNPPEVVIVELVPAG